MKATHRILFYHVLLLCIRERQWNKMLAVAEVVFSVPSLAGPESWMKLCLPTPLLSEDMACGIHFSSICPGQSEAD